MGKFVIRISRFEALRPEHRDKAYRASVYQQDLAILQSASNFLQLDLTGSDDSVPRKIDWSQKVFKSNNVKIRNCLMGYEYSESTINVQHFSLTLEIRVKGDDCFVVDYFDELVELILKLKATKAILDPDVPFTEKKGLWKSSGFIRTVVSPEALISAFKVSTFDTVLLRSQNAECELDLMKNSLESVARKVAKINDGLVFCAHKSFLYDEEYYRWNCAVTKALGLYGYGNLPTTRRYGKFYWDRDACPEFFASLPDDLTERLYGETPLTFKTVMEPVCYEKGGPSLRLILPGIEDETSEKTFWDRYLKKYLGPHDAAVHTMMHQYDRFL